MRNLGWVWSEDAHSKEHRRVVLDVSEKWERFRQRLPYLRCRRQVFLDFRWEGLLPRLVVHEGYESLVRWTLRAVTAAGLGLSLVTISPPLGVLISLLLVGVEQFLERTTFRFTTLFIQPIPDFEYAPDEWEAMVFLINRAGQDAIGCLFKSFEYGTKFFEYLRAWNYEDGEDLENNIQLSFVVKGDTYYTFIYPSAQRPTVQKAAEQAEVEMALEDPGKEHFQILLQLVYCKGFVRQESSSLSMFVEEHEDGKPFLFAPVTRTPGGGLKQVAEGITKYDYKYYEWGQMTGREFEYDYMSRPEFGS